MFVEHLQDLIQCIHTRTAGLLELEVVGWRALGVGLLDAGLALKGIVQGGEDIVPTLLEAADALDLDVRVVPESEWEAGKAEGICISQPNLRRPRVEAKTRDSGAALAGVLIHEYAHALLHVGVDDETERSKREVEAEAVAYVVGRHFGLDTSDSAFYLAAWQDEDTDGLQERLSRISRTASEIIGTMPLEESDAEGD